MSHAKKTALITGSGRNIGRGIAHELAKAGHNIVINGSKNRSAAEAVAEEVRALGVDASVAMGNVGVRQEAELIINKVVDAFGGIDILINNAAIFSSNYSETLDTNLKATAQLMLFFYKNMKKGHTAAVNRSQRVRMESVF